MVADFNVIRKMLAHDLMQVYVRLFLLTTVVWFSVEVFARLWRWRCGR